MGSTTQTIVLNQDRVELLLLVVIFVLSFQLMTSVFRVNDKIKP